MSMTKRWMETENEIKRRAEKENCGCRYNFDDHFEELCEKHQDEADEAAERENCEQMR